jgi:hypothetical protein
MSANATIRLRADAARDILAAPGWNPKTRGDLAKLIHRGSGKRLPVAVDFDNTIVHGDIGEATMAVLARSGLLTPARLAPALCPSFRRPGKKLLELQSCADVIEYYNALLAPTIHGRNDPTPLANGYAWAVQVMCGLRLADVTQATRLALASSRPGQPSFIEVTPGQTSVRVPTFHAETVELLAELIRREFDVWIVSASNVWSVRWMVQHALNPLLRQHKLPHGIQADHVIGISTLLADDQDCLFKDALLVRENPEYAALEEKVAGAFRLTSQLQFPVPSYSGKVACLFDAIGRRPYLCIGDGPGDQAMMDVSEHQLWIAPQGKDQMLHKTAALARSTGELDRIKEGEPVSGPPSFLGSSGFVPAVGPPVAGGGRCAGY